MDEHLRAAPHHIRERYALAKHQAVLTGGRPSRQTWGVIPDGPTEPEGEVMNVREYTGEAMASLLSAHQAGDEEDRHLNLAAAQVQALLAVAAAISDLAEATREQ
ncbi:hypothetical protein ACWGLG_16620 [Streptomyces antimycoticus]